MENNNKQSPHIAIFDVSSHLHRIFHSLKKQNQENNLIHPFFDLIKREIGAIGNVSHCIFAFDGAPKENFRNEIYPEYKENRPPPEEIYVEQKRLVYSTLKKMGATVLCYPKYEADDLIGSISKRLSSKNIEHTIATRDKDLFCLVNDCAQVFLGLNKGVYGIKEVKADKGILPEQMNDYLTLVGDASDNIKGVDGIGAKKAIKILEKMTFSELMENPEKILDLDGFTGKQKAIDYLKNNEDEIWFMRSIIQLEDNVKLDFNLSNSRLSNIDFSFVDQNFEKPIQTNNRGRKNGFNR